MRFRAANTRFEERWIVNLDGEEQGINFLRVLAQEAFDASNVNSNNNVHYDPSLVMTTILADELMYTGQDDKITLGMDWVAGRCIKIHTEIQNPAIPGVFLVLTSHGEGGYSEGHGHNHDTVGKLLERVKARLEKGEVSLPEEQPITPDTGGVVFRLYREIHHSKIVGVSWNKGDGTFNLTQYARLNAARRPEPFRNAPLRSFDKRAKFDEFVKEDGFPEDLVRELSWETGVTQCSFCSPRK